MNNTENRNSIFSFCKKFIAFFCFQCFLFLGLHAQFYNGSQLSFGKNRVQHQNFYWTYYRNNQFDVYFYPNSKQLAEYTYAKVPQYIEEIERLFNFTSYKKLQFIVYNTQGDFRESNFAYDNDNFYNQGGITNIYGTKIYLYFDGNHHHFDKMIKSGIANTYAHLLIEGQNMGSNMSSGYLIDVPKWYYSGLSSYISENWDSETDAYIKNGILSQRFIRFEDLSPIEATYAGHSFWKFIIDRYGESVLPNILYTTRTMRSVEKGFSFVTGVDFKSLIEDWYRYYYVIYKKDIQRNKPENAGLLKHPRPNREYQNIILSPDGKDFAYITNEDGQIKVWLQKSNENKPKIIFKKYPKTEDNPDLSFPIIGWHPNGKIIGITMEERGRCYFYPYQIEEKKKGKRMLVDVEKISSWSYSKDGTNMIFSGFKGGESDIYLYNFRSRSYQNLTNDFYDDYGPQFINNERDIIFSSNRPHDTLNNNEKFYNSQNQSFYDIYLYHYQAKDPQLLRVTHTPTANEKDIQVIDDQQILYLSDQNGIMNRYYARFDSSITTIDTAIHYAYYAKSKPITNNAYSIFDQYYNKSDQKIGEIVLNKGVKRLFIHELEDISINYNPSLSHFKSKNNQIQQQVDSIKQVALNTKRGTNTVTGRRHGFHQVTKKSNLYPNEDILSNDTVTGKKSGVQALPFTRGFEYIQLTPRNYYIQYTVNKLITQADYGFLNTSYQQFSGDTSPIYLNTGINALFMVGINDLFENYRITGGYRMSFDLSGNEFMLSYEDLSKRIDHQIVAYRQSIKKTIENKMYKQQSNSIFYILKYPFNKFNSLRFTLTGRYEQYILGSLNDESLTTPDLHKIWGGIKMEYIFDSSKELSTNLWRGSKIKIFGEYNQLISKEKKNLLVVGFDARKSVKLYRNMTWATRIAASSNIGKSRLVYYMGGVDNWIGAKFNGDIWVDQTKDYEYQTLVTNMRGFSQNIRNGTSFALFSTELRIPFVQMIARKQLSSVFLNSMQLILFTDIGTAWTGITPYSEENCLYSRYVTKGSITAIIKRQVDPWIVGFGGGLRMSLLGYFFRIDYAWGAENLKINDKKGMFMFSIGTDF